MSVTYTEDQVSPTAETDFVPTYARRSVRRQKKVKTWMILAPIAAVALIGGGAAMLMNGGENATPLVEPAPEPAAAVAPMVAEQTAPSDAVMASAGTPELVAPAPVPVPAPVARQVEPARSVPVRRATPAVTRRATPTTIPAATPTSRVETPAEPTGLRAYTASPSEAAPAPTTTPPAPAIAVSPLN